MTDSVELVLTIDDCYDIIAALNHYIDLKDESNVDREDLVDVRNKILDELGK